MFHTHIRYEGVPPFIGIPTCRLVFIMDREFLAKHGSSWVTLFLCARNEANDMIWKWFFWWENQRYFSEVAGAQRVSTALRTVHAAFITDCSWWFVLCMTRVVHVRVWGVYITVCGNGFLPGCVVGLLWVIWCSESREFIDGKLDDNFIFLKLWQLSGWFDLLHIFWFKPTCQHDSAWVDSCGIFVRYWYPTIEMFCSFNKTFGGICVVEQFVIFSAQK